MAELTIAIYPGAFTCNSFALIAFAADLGFLSGQHLLAYGPLIWAVPYFFYGISSKVAGIIFVGTG
jgi:hypothetical protein